MNVLQLWKRFVNIRCYNEIKLKGIVSDRTLISLLPFIDDIDFEFEQREEELTSTYGQLYNELPDTASQLSNASE